MKETNYWKQFTMTGSVEDYLRYRSFADNSPKEQSDSAEKWNGAVHAGVRGCHRDRDQDGSDRRI